MSIRVAITGMGVVSPCGIGLDAFWSNLINGKSGIAPIKLFDASEYPSRIAGEVQDFNPEDYIDRKESRRMDRFIQFGVIAAKMAIDDAQLKIDKRNAEKVGVLVGSGIGGLYTMERQHQVLIDRGPSRVSPFLVPMMICDLAAGQISIAFGQKDRILV